MRSTLTRATPVLTQNGVGEVVPHGSSGSPFCRPLFSLGLLFPPSSSGPRFGVQTISNFAFVEAGRCCGSPSRALAGPVVGHALNLRPRNTPWSCREAKVHSLYTVQRIPEVQDSGGGGDFDGPGGDKGGMDSCHADGRWCCETVYPTKSYRPALPACSRFGIPRETGPCNARQPNRVTVGTPLLVPVSKTATPMTQVSIPQRERRGCVDHD